MNRMTMCSPELFPGFRFHPTDQELIIHYLRKKVSCIFKSGSRYNSRRGYLQIQSMGTSSLGYLEASFSLPLLFCLPVQEKPCLGRASGFSLAQETGNTPLMCLGVKKALVFYKGRPPKGLKTSWLMLEYRLLEDTHHLHRLRGTMRLDDWVLCRVRQKSNTRSQNGDDHRSNFSSFSPFTSLRCLQGQEIFKKGNTLKDYYYDLQPCLMAPAESERQMSKDKWSSKKYLQNTQYSQVRIQVLNQQWFPLSEKLEYIKKILSIGALEELVPTTPKKRLHVSSSNNAENAYIFDELPSPPKKRLHIFSSNKAANDCIF
ncbi:hypothetical protein POTOM_040710 [Populus tomentosa]|uniref:NAC domain-containing protein n=1 Tax=Populus tomentosa TaxID=118781 RepID=A0A8X7YTB0_POPTO|nr:hypothetical protein POTOM_040710 [Populus tomentosa]